MTTFSSSSDTSINSAINSQLHHDFVTHIGSTLIAGIAIFLIFFAIYFFFKNEKNTRKQRIRYRFRVIYIAIFFYLMFLARIWVEGFEHIFTMLSLVGAGIVVTNKETVMNFVGWLIITWRNLFTEGDVIQIGNNIGIIGRIGLLYFRLYETTGIDRLETTGKSIKIPNGLVITLPITCVSPENNLLQYAFNLQADPAVEKLRTTIDTIQNEFNAVLAQYYKKHCTEGFKRLEESHEEIASFISQKCSLVFQLAPGKDKHAEITLRFFCYPKDFQMLQLKFLEMIGQASQEERVFLATPKA
jgi:moderate conductance mechanosensitive channel